MHPCLLPVALTILLRAPAPLQEATAATSAWDGFPAVGWVDAGQTRNTQFFQALKDQAIGSCNVPGNLPSSTESLARMAFIVVPMVEGEALSLSAESFAAERQAFLDARLGARPRRPISLSDPAVLADLEVQVRAAVRKHKNNRPSAYCITDELSVTNGVAPFDYSFDEHTLDEMRKWLTTRYRDLEELNQTWQTSFGRLSEVVPETTDEARARNAGRRLSELNFASWSDHREFMNVQLARVMGSLVKVVRSEDPGVPVGFLGGEMPSAFGGCDWYRLAPQATFLEAYEGALAPRMLHSFASPRSVVLSTLFLSEDGKGDDQGVIDVWNRLGRGDDGVVVWSSAQMFRDAKQSPTTAVRDVSRTLRTARKLFAKLDRGQSLDQDVLLFTNPASIRASWMVDSWSDGDDWVLRTTEQEADEGQMPVSLEAWESLLEELGLSFRFVDGRDLVAKGGVELGAKVIILPVAMALSDIEIFELIRFAAAGGVIVGDAWTAVFDEHLRGRDNRGLTALFGLRRPEEGTLQDLSDWLSGARVSRTGVRHFGLREGEDAIVAEEGQATEKSLGFDRGIGLGRALFFNSDLRGYESVADSQPQYAEALRTSLADYLTQHTALQLTPHLPYDNTCRRFRMYRYGGPTDGSLLIVPRETPVVDRTMDLSLGHLVEVESVLDNVLMGNRRRVTVRVGLDRPLLLRIRPAAEEAADGTRGPRKQESPVADFLAQLERKQQLELQNASELAAAELKKQKAAATQADQAAQAGKDPSADKPQKKKKAKKPRRRRRG